MCKLYTATGKIGATISLIADFLHNLSHINGMSAVGARSLMHVNTGNEHCFCEKARSLLNRWVSYFVLNHALTTV